MLRSTGNVKLPSMINIGMCFLDAIFNLLLIFPTATYKILGLSITVPGAGLGVAGAALGTILAESVSTFLLLWFLVVKSDKIALVGHPGSFLPEIFCMRRVARIGSPIALERMAMSSAQIVTTMIVAPLGPLSLAAHSFAITAESLCYMPGYGVADAASTIVGQSIGAKRPDMARRFSKINVIMVMVIMSAMGVVMYLTAPWMIGFMTTNQSIIELGSSALRIEAFAEPMFAAAIVSCSIFVSAGFTLFPSLMNLGSMWLIRIPLAYYLASRMGLDGGLRWPLNCASEVRSSYLPFQGLIFRSVGVLKINNLVNRQNAGVKPAFFKSERDRFQFRLSISQCNKHVPIKDLKTVFICNETSNIVKRRRESKGLYNHLVLRINLKDAVEVFTYRKQFSFIHRQARDVKFTQTSSFFQ